MVPNRASAPTGGPKVLTSVKVPAPHVAQVIELFRGPGGGR